MLNMLSELHTRANFWFFRFFIAGMDYEPLSATVMFLSSSGLNPMQCQNVTLLDDDTEEDGETFQVQISSSDCILAQTEATVTIIDDGMYYLTFSTIVMLNFVDKYFMVLPISDG